MMLDDIRIRAKEYRRKVWFWNFNIKLGRSYESIRPICQRWMDRVTSRVGHVGGTAHLSLRPKYGQRHVEVACYVYEDVPEDSRVIFERQVDDPRRDVIYLPEISPVLSWAPES